MLILLLLLPVVVMATADHLTLATADGLRITFSADGRVTSLAVDGRELVTNHGGGLFLQDLSEPTELINLVPNHGFELGTTMPTGWAVTVQQGNAAWTLDTADPFEGKNSLRLRTLASTDAVEVRSDPFPVQPGDYYLSLRVRTKHGFLDPYWGGLISAGVFWLDGQGRVIALTEATKIAYTTSNWTRLVRKVTAPAGATAARIGLRVKGNVPNATSENVVWFDLIEFFTEPATMKRVAVGSTVTQNPDGSLSQTATLASGLQITATLRGLPDRLELQGEVVDLTGRGRALEAGFALPIDARGWTWWDDIRNKRQISEGVYWEIVNADLEGNLPFSIYPYSALNDAATGLSYGVSLSEPRIFRIYYDADLKEYAISFSLGTSPKATLPNRATFSFILYKHDPRWGFRAATKRYYEFNPPMFPETTATGRSLRRGSLAAPPRAWQPDDPLLKNPEDFGVRFAQGAFESPEYAQRVLPLLNKAGIGAFVYALPWEWETARVSGNLPPPTYNEALAAFERDTQHPVESFRLRAAGARNSVLKHPNGDVAISRMNRPEYAGRNWNAKFPINLSPNLPAPNAAGTNLEARVKPAFTNARKINATLDGVMLDNFMKQDYFVDHDPVRFRLSKFPLTYSMNTLQPAVHSFFTAVEYLQYLKEYLKANEPEALVGANAIDRGVATFGFPYLDGLGFECAPIGGFNWSDKDLNYRRIMAYKRSVIANDIDGPVPGTSYAQLEPQLIRFFNIGLLYGIYANALKVLDSLKLIEESRALHRKYIPIFDALTEAGWEPVTSAQVNDPELFLERFGPVRAASPSQGPIYFVLLNNPRLKIQSDPADVSKTYRLTVFTEELNLVGDLEVREVLSGAVVPFTIEGGKLIISGIIGAGEALVFQVGLRRAKVISVSSRSYGATMARELYESGKVQEAIAFYNRYYAHRRVGNFYRPIASSVYVLWSEAGATVALPVQASSVTVTDIFGQERTADPSRLVLTASSIFVEVRL